MRKSRHNEKTVLKTLVSGLNASSLPLPIHNKLMLMIDKGIYTPAINYLKREYRYNNIREDDFNACIMILRSADSLWSKHHKKLLNV
jgi:hypothetical protein